tara:strand:- start:24 stop:167 length:144 start_codon:yes stop_codon:yes gene_type:complete
MNKTHWEKVEKDNEEIMKRIHPAAMIPGFAVGLIVVVGCVFKIYMGW